MAIKRNGKNSMGAAAEQRLRVELPVRLAHLVNRDVLAAATIALEERIEQRKSDQVATRLYTQVLSTHYARMIDCD
jgi:hypothetical protein